MYDAGFLGPGVGVVVQQIAVHLGCGRDLGAEDRREVPPGRREHLLELPRDLDVLDDRSCLLEGLGRRAGVGLDLGVDLPAAEIDREPDAPAFDAFQHRGDAYLRPQRRHVGGVRAGEHVLEQRAVGDRAGERPVVAVAVEVERRLPWARGRAAA